MKKFQKLFIGALIFMMASFAFADDWFVCVGSYSSVDNASELVYSLQKKGINTFVYEFAKDNGSKLYRVLIDEPFDSRDKARIRRDNLENNEVIKSLRISGLWICQAAEPDVSTSAELVPARQSQAQAPEQETTLFGEQETTQAFETNEVSEDVPAVKFVLEWNDETLDLDTVLLTSKYFIDYDEPIVAGIRLTYDANLDYAPETLTIQAIDPVENYNYYVVDCANYDFDDSGALSASGANVKIYINGEYQAKIDITPGQKGPVWHVFDIINSEIVPVDTVGAEDLYE